MVLLLTYRTLLRSKGGLGTARVFLFHYPEMCSVIPVLSINHIQLDWLPYTLARVKDSQYDVYGPGCVSI